MMFRKRVSAKKVSTTVNEGKTRDRPLQSKSSVTTFYLNNTSGTYRKHQPSKNSRIPGENEARSLLDVGTRNKLQVTPGKCLSSQHHPFEIEPTRSSEMRKHVRPSRLFSTPTNKDLDCTKRKGFYYTGPSKKWQQCKETELMTRNETSKIYHDKLSTSENQFFSISNIETHDNKQAEDGIHKQDLNNSNLHKDKTFAENFSLRSSQHEPTFIFSSPPRSQIVTRSQIIANPPGAPRALFRKKSYLHAPSPLNLRKQAHLSSSELDHSWMETESSDNDESSFAFLCRKLEF